MRFSQRFGYKPVREIIQKESMDENLKNQLWNNIGLCIFRNYKSSATLVRNYPISNSNLEVFFSSFYHHFLKKE
ncbi:AbiJ-NTD4 domain-containing protein [Acinetobacter sp.]|uniref:AbiJ-NTD4 domain-containing protein n=1 Tax=Acinetobacter sp. TaxID=472 RepID=UPI00388E6F9C